MMQREARRLPSHRIGEPVRLKGGSRLSSDALSVALSRMKEKGNFNHHHKKQQQRGKTQEKENQYQNQKQKGKRSKSADLLDFSFTPPPPSPPAGARPLGSPCTTSSSSGPFVFRSDGSHRRDATPAQEASASGGEQRNRLESNEDENNSGIDQDQVALMLRKRRRTYSANALVNKNAPNPKERRMQQMLERKVYPHYSLDEEEKTSAAAGIHHCVRDSDRRGTITIDIAATASLVLVILVVCRLMIVHWEISPTSLRLFLEHVALSLSPPPWYHSDQDQGNLSALHSHVERLHLFHLKGFLGVMPLLPRAKEELSAIIHNTMVREGRAAFESGFTFMAEHGKDIYKSSLHLLNWTLLGAVLLNLYRYKRGAHQNRISLSIVVDMLVSTGVFFVGYVFVVWHLNFHPSLSICT
jgi:hypothetical protein